MLQEKLVFSSWYQIHELNKLSNKQRKMIVNIPFYAKKKKKKKPLATKFSTNMNLDRRQS
jgi:hypothetical protein